ncbi:unnamed protein product [Camellia sinensis]
MMERGYGGVGGGGSGYPYESGVVMSRDPKPRLRWTADLHDRFVDAVTKLGGPDTSNSQVGAESDGRKGLDVVPFKESFTGKYRLGQQAKKHNTIEQNRENNDGSYRDYQVHSSSATTHSLGVNTEQGELPIAEALRCQVEVQKRLQEQLEVQKKLQMRIEAQGKYLQTILEKAQKSLTLDMNFPAASVEATRAQLTNFNLALSNLMENVDGEVRNENNIHKSLLNDINRKANGSLYLGEVEERKDIKLKVEGGSVNFDLNTRGSYDFIGTSRSEMEAKTLAYRS